MNEYAILHIPDSRYCFPVGEKELVLRLRMAREDEKAKVFLVYAQKYDFTFCREKVPMEIKYSDRLYHYYEIKMRLTDVRFAYIFQIEEEGNTWYFSEDGVTKEYRFEEGFYNFFQMPYINKNDVLQTVDWMRSAVFYQIFVERFRQGNYKKDTSYVDMKWGDLPTPKSFAGGDLAGIIEKIDYIQELGINAIYLTPIFQSVSNHKYDISDYFTVDPQFGTMEDLKKLVRIAHEKNIRVVLDAVFNHCSMEMKQFQDVLEKGRDSSYYHWFLIDGDVPDPENRNYECFAACSYMPKLNTANEEVQEFLIEVALYWIREADIDGWRLDVSDEVSHEFWRRFRKAVKQEKPDSVIIGENWHDAYPYLMGDQYDSIMNYAFTKACLDYFAKGVFTAKDMAEKLNSNLMRNMEQVNRMMLNLLDSHDTHRFFTEVGKDKDKVLAAVALEMIFMGAPCIYYGTEICTEGGYDPDSRRCFSWDTASWDMDFMEMMKELIRLRKQPAVQFGDIKVTEEQGMLVVERNWKESKIILRINMESEEKVISTQKKNSTQEEVVLCENKCKNFVLGEKGFLVTITEE